MSMVDTVYWLPIYAGLQLRPAGLVQRRRPPGAISVLIAWTEWTLTMALSWWHHYKYHRGYYYY